MEEKGQSPSMLRKILTITGKILLCAICLILCLYPTLILYVLFMHPLFLDVITYGSFLILPSLIIGLIVLKNRKKFMKYWAISLAVFLVVAGLNFAYILHDENITIDTSPNIKIHEYLPFDESSKIVKLDDASLQLEGDLPIVDGAAAVFPVYSAFVHATYPETTELYDGVFEYNNTVGGYMLLGEKETDIFFGAYPSEDQIDEAAKNGTTFVYTPIGTEAFVFFVHKDNPIDSLTTEQLRGIYSGEITNWRQVGGKNEPIIAFQRNQGSGSQSMLIRFMEGAELMEAPTETTIGGMMGIVEQVSNYRNKKGSIGFSFRYYLEGIIQNPDIKLLSIDGVAPTVENIKSGAYPITTPLYAVTWEGNPNENVQKLINWILSEEGQEIIERTGYAGCQGQ